MAESTFKQQTFGNFEARGIITVVPNDTFQVDLKGKNNTNWNYSKMNMKMEDGKGGSFYINAVDGFDIQKGRTIYANIKDSRDQMQIAFADRFNSDILQHIDNRSFISVALRKVENDEGKMVWEYNNFLTFYDVINFIKDRFETGMKLYIRGNVKYRMYQNKLQKDFDIQSIYLLPQDEDTDLGFTFKQTVLLTDDSLDMGEWEEKGIVKLNSKLYTIAKDKDTKEKYVDILDLPLIVRSNDKTKDAMQRMIDKFLSVQVGKVRKIRLEGRFNNGYIQGQVTKDDLPPEALELIQDGFYTEEEVLKMYAGRDRIEEMTVTRPVINKDKDSGKPQVDYSDTEYNIDDLISTPPVKTDTDQVNDNNDEDLSFLDGLE